MSRIPYRPEELTVVGTHITPTEPVRPAPMPRYQTPITPKENLRRALNRDGTALWFPTAADYVFVQSRTNVDHIARAEIRDLGPVQPLEEKGGPDLFGIPWVFVPTAGGSMVEPGKPVLEDVNDWPEIIRFPDVDALDWEGCKINAPFNESVRGLGITFQNGMFERLISFMDFENAAVAIVDEDQQEAVHALFARLCEMYEAMITKYGEILKLDGILFHDDWGSQRAPFFSNAVCEEMVAPYLKRISDFCHDRGMWFHLHSCGMNELVVPAMISAGVDIWMPQPMNDADKLVRQYGEHIAFGVTPPPVAEDATDEEVEDAARAFVAKYAPDFDRRPVIVNTRFAPERYVNAIYRQSRIALCGEA